jgi:prepilin-type N-terminal cleavage/methylation domain-containing protein
MFVKLTRPRRSAGFTLVELLAVVAVVGLLAAIAIPIFASQTSQASRAVAISDGRAWASTITTQLRSYTDFGTPPANTTTAITLGAPSSGEATLTVTMNAPTPSTSAVLTEQVAVSGGTTIVASGMSGLTWCFAASNNGQVAVFTETGYQAAAAGCEVNGDISTTPLGPITPVVPAGPIPNLLTSLPSAACTIAQGAPYCWGADVAGSFGTGGAVSVAASPIAAATPGALVGRTVTSVEAGAGHTCAVADGLAFCWGTNTNGNLGNGTTTNSSTPVAVSTAGVLAGKTVTAIAAGTSHTCAIADGQAFCWGLGTNGRLGNGTTTSSNVPVAVDTTGALAGRTVTALAVGSNHTCVVADDAAFCWGGGGNGRLGNGALTDRTTPTAVSVAGVLSGRTVNAIAAGANFTCAVADSQAFCWGSGANGRLGNGATTNALIPVSVSTAGVLAGRIVTAVTADGAGSYACALADSRSFCWGANSTGQLGDGTTTESSTPVETSVAGVLAARTLDALSAGASHTCALSSGDLFCWGLGDSGELGDGTMTSSLVPVAVSPLPTP